MTVSDETAGGPHKRNWPAIRRQYETGTMALRPFAKLTGIPFSTLAKRSMREGWKQKRKLVAEAARKLEAELDERAVQIVREELAPWIEQKKTAITKRGYNISERGLDRIETLFDQQMPSDTKSESEAARAAETFLRMARTSLGMNDSTAGPQPLSLTILTNQAAVAVNYTSVTR